MKSYIVNSNAFTKIFCNLQLHVLQDFTKVQVCIIPDTFELYLASIVVSSHIFIRSYQKMCTHKCMKGFLMAKKPFYVLPNTAVVIRICITERTDVVMLQRLFREKKPFDHLLFCHRICLVLKCGICYIIMGTYLDTDTERIICSYILKVFQKQSISNKAMVKKHPMIFSGSTMQLCVTLTDFLPCLNKILKKSCNLVQTEAFFPQWDLVFWQKNANTIYFLYSLHC